DVRAGVVGSRTSPAAQVDPLEPFASPLESTGQSEQVVRDRPGGIRIARDQVFFDEAQLLTDGLPRVFGGVPKLPEILSEGGIVGNHGLLACSLRLSLLLGLHLLCQL